jgi:acetyltransferase-like isoleucine patch superfamily enzyme
MHGTHLGDEAAGGGNTFCDYGTKVGKGAILGNGSATNVEQVIPDNALAEGVPAKVVRQNLKDEDRQKYFGLLPKGWTKAWGEWEDARGK